MNDTLPTGECEHHILALHIRTIMLQTGVVNRCQKDLFQVFFKGDRSAAS